MTAQKSYNVLESEPMNSALFDELRGMGFVEGQNLSVVPGGFRLRDEQLAEAAAALVKSAPDAIVTAGPIATRAAQAATKTIAIVGSADDMVQNGLVSSMRHPGSNTTGRAASGHVAAPPRNVTNSRRLIRLPRQRGPKTIPEFSARAPWRS
jgi:hypothetical protein